MRFNYEPGVWMMSDFSGKDAAVAGPADGQKMVEILVCVLPCFRLDLRDGGGPIRPWHRGPGRIAPRFEYYGGVARRLICDNLRSAVTKWSHGDAVLNRTFADFARCLWHRSAPCPADAAPG